MPINPITTGYTFSGTSPNNNVTAEKLNALVNQATISPVLITGQPESTALAAGDYLLGWNSAANAFCKISAGNAFTAARGKPGAVNLKVNVATDTTATVTADYILMRRSNGNLYVATSFNNTPDISTYSAPAAPNGRDFSSSTSIDTWYYLWAISDGINDRALWSVSPSSPTLPTGYVYSCLLGAVRNGHTGLFTIGFQHGNDVALNLISGAATTSTNQNPITGGGEFTTVSPATGGTFQAATLINCIPPNIVSRVRGIIGIAGNVAARRTVAVASTSNGTFASPSVTNGLQLGFLNAVQAVSGGASVDGTATFGFDAAMTFDLPVRDSQTIAWTASATGAIMSMRITGYTLAL